MSANSNVGILATLGVNGAANEKDTEFWQGHIDAIKREYLCRVPIDFRKSIDGLSTLVEQELVLNLFGSALYVFINRGRNKIMALYWHRNGFCLWYERLEADKFAWPRDADGATQTVTMQEFEWLLQGFDLWRNQPHKTLHFTPVSQADLVKYYMPFIPQKSSFLPLPVAPSGALAAFTLPTVLPDDVVALKALLRVQNNTLLTQVHAHQIALDAQRRALNAEIETVRREAQEQITRMIDQLVLARHRQFGVSTEQLSGQARLFDEAEVLAQATTEAADIAPLPPQTPAVDAGGNKQSMTPARGKRRPLPTELPRVDVVHDVPDDQRTCPCGTPTVEIGQDVSEQLDIVPMQVRVLHRIRERYGCPGSVHAPVTAPLPPQPLPKSNASPDFLAMLLVVKFIDGLPLARFEYVLDRHGMPVPRQTLARWVIGAASLLQPLHNLMRDVLLDSAFLHMDETVVQVLKEDGKTPTSTSYMWVQMGGPPDKPVILFDYDPSRSSEVPARLLEGYRGYLMTNGYDAYNYLVRRRRHRSLGVLGARAQTLYGRRAGAAKGPSRQGR